MNGSPNKGRDRRSGRPKGDPASGATRVNARSFRPRIDRSLEVYATRILTERDRNICHNLYEHHVLTTKQLWDLHFTFTNPRVARRRLLKLYEARILDRFRPHRDKWGSHPIHYIMDEIAIRIVAADRAIDPKRIRYRVQRDRDLAKSSRLNHLVETNGFFTTLVRACLTAGDHQLSEWWGEERCAAEWRGSLEAPLVRPDGQAVVGSPTGTCRFVLELDRGTERGDRLSHKLHQYQLIGGSDDSPDALIFLFPSLDREVNARRHLNVPTGMSVATSHPELFEGDPLGAIWLPVGAERRVPLIRLPGRNS
ncbi:MAG: hypothetical protein GEU73_14165 [Chloroflexi bacterium]|nr:hypothetical protein [Chloroflexota bacterium]